MKKKVEYQWDGTHWCPFCDTDREEKGTMEKCVCVCACGSCECNTREEERRGCVMPIPR